jgi:hypothetical protein
MPERLKVIPSQMKEFEPQLKEESRLGATPRTSASELIQIVGLYLI